MWLAHHMPFQWVGGEQRSRFQINHRSAIEEAHIVRGVLLEDGKRERLRHTLQTSSIQMRVSHGDNIQSNVFVLGWLLKKIHRSNINHKTTSQAWVEMNINLNKSQQCQMEQI
jgi:hypothetical protein